VLVFGRRQRRDARQTELAGVQKAPRSRGKLGTGWQRVLWGFNVGADLDDERHASTTPARCLHTRGRESAVGRFGARSERINGRTADWGRRGGRASGEHHNRPNLLVEPRGRRVARLFGRRGSCGQSIEIIIPHQLRQRHSAGFGRFVQTGISGLPARRRREAIRRQKERP
jgi:hypothetical protein